MTTEVDLWEDEGLILDEISPLQLNAHGKDNEFDKNVEAKVLHDSKLDDVVISEGKQALLLIKDNKIYLYSRKQLQQHPGIAHDFEGIHGLKVEKLTTNFLYLMNLNAVNSFILRHTLKLIRLELSPEDGKVLQFWADKIPLPEVVLSPTGKHVEIHCGAVKTYQDILKKINAYPTKAGWRVSISRVLDLEAMLNLSVTTLPLFSFNEEVKALTREPLPNYDGTLNSLKNISIGELHLIAANLQMNKQLKNSKKTLTEKMEDFGIVTLHDLLFKLPKRFIDKSNPQPIDELLIGESVTIIGEIVQINDLPNNMGVFFMVEDEAHNKVKTTFWRQQWLRTKFKVGDEVLITGKVNYFRGKLDIGGASIEHAEEAAVLPIVPIYKQSETRGVTTNLIMSANRELLSRLDKLTLPAYLRKHKDMDYKQAITELHFPTSLDNFKRACNVLAYYELVYMQLLMQEEKEKETGQKAVALSSSDENLQKELIENLPFQLTKSQKIAVNKANSLFSEEKPSQILLNGDVGSGKSLTAQLLALRAIENGKQVVIVGPTEILARQLYETTKREFNRLASPPTVGFLGAGMKAAEKKPVIAAAASGELSVIVGTTSVMADKVKYKELGLIIIDEQQKFGAEQRSKLLEARADGLIPHLVLMSATPIPRSTAQVFYGDMEMIELTEKPPGRLPIETEWIQEDPIGFTHQINNKVWADIIAETQKGNQVFIITPMVLESDKVDAASVEASFKTLQENALRGVPLGFIHGRMKKEEQQAVMEDFRNKKILTLVSSTVVEVGVDIPDATRVVVLSADRLGASSLHQIRGRVGRSNKQSKCYLISSGKTLNSQVRLQSLVDSENGFDIALADLEVRGEGKMFGTAQSGSSEMIFASLARHRDWISQAQEDATKILNSRYAHQALADARDRFTGSERFA